ncbi:MAG: ATP-dependent helicase [Clostridiales bacterium]|jgi:DNA helicase-2/ATP-dependent DNA helicase PcrA|nr:ATP-dependent helicase [Clostridiales bacterium]
MPSLSLNKAQEEAARHKIGPMMVLAGPGSGKTTVLIHRVLNLIESGVNPDSILVISFTKASTEEMKQRFLSLCPIKGSRVAFSTFHALFYRIIRASASISAERVLSEDQRKSMVEGIMKSMGLSVEEDFVHNALNEISLIKSDLIDISFYNSMHFSSEAFMRLFKNYEDCKSKSNLMDFDDMLVKCHELLLKEPNTLAYWQNRHPHILVDEFQDINQAQYRCIRMLAGKSRNLFIVGDDDQSIYGFRGARPEFLLKFPSDFPDACKAVLDTNYRSTEEIITLGNSVIAPNRSRFAKSMKGTGRCGMSPEFLQFDNPNDEAGEIGKIIKRLHERGLRYRDAAVIYRVNVNSRAFADAFISLGIPFQIKDDNPSVYEHWIAKDVCAYLSLSLGSGSSDLYARIVNKPSRYISTAAIKSARAGGAFISNLYRQGLLKSYQLDRVSDMLYDIKSLSGLKTSDAVAAIRKRAGYDSYIESYCDYKKIDSASLFELLDEIEEASGPFQKIEDFLSHVDIAVKKSKEQKENKREKSEQDGVLLTTMHSAKGMEFSTVFVTGAVEGSVPHKKSKTDAEIEEERRLFYVGITRAKDRLYISAVNKRYDKDVKITRFLTGITGNNIPIGDKGRLAEKRLTHSK